MHINASFFINGTPPGAPWIILIIAMMAAIALIIAVIIKTGNLYLDGKPPKKRKK